MGKGQYYYLKLRNKKESPLIDLFLVVNNPNLIYHENLLKTN